MTFDQWWATLTEPEQKLLGRTNAKYVWVCATENERERILEICKEGWWDAAGIRLHAEGDKHD
jgi:hypothetical protein